MKTTVTLEPKDVRIIIARFLGIHIEDVIPQRYGFSVAGVPQEEIAWKLSDQEQEADK